MESTQERFVNKLYKLR